MNGKKTKKPNRFIESQKYFLKLIISEHPKSFVLYFVIALLTSIIPPILIALNKYTMDSISKIGSDELILNTVLILLGITFAVQYTSAVLTNVDEYIFVRISQTVNFVLKRLLIKKQVEVPMEKYEESKFFDNLNLANSAISRNGIMVVDNTFGIGKNLLSLLGIFGLLMSIHWSMPIALFLSTLPGIIVIFITKQRSYKMNMTTSPASRELDFTDKLFSTKNALTEIKIFGLGDYLLDKWSNLYGEIQSHTLKLAGWEAKAKSFAVLFLQLSSMLVSVLLVNQISKGTLSIGDYVALLGAVTTVQGLFGSAGGNLGSIYEAAIFNNALLDVLEYKVKNIGSDKKDIKEINSIQLKNVSFKYPEEDRFAIRNVNLSINKGESISIVGYNGSGKSTLIKCLTGLYNVSSGEITVNGIKYDDVSEKSLFKKISIVFQDFYKYKYSIQENVGFGNVQNIDDENELHRLLSDVELSERLRDTKHSLQTYLTKELPYGIDLSGGEWQRIAIARARFKDADLFILDEPTAAIDPISEVKVFKLFQEISSSHTSITISHRLGPTKFADRIIVMDDGAIVEEGSFDELIALRGFFYEMYEAQAEWYKEEMNA
ncbi:ABC transporter ATP-binding protein [Exiguobacterium sp. s57]|uniref:ABC transporter ATP-binding protein n=1 Tax=Exiguobacterium sp. s57 TaxID=2751258 RepID=UPI001BE7EE42|nr:ABC transporter ATP-binding protein [Exiguobacterium sp. s57]